MKLFEYQAKSLFKEHGIKIPTSILVHEPAELAEAVRKIGLPCVLKAQVLHGGRGKAGLVKLTRVLSEALEEGQRIMAATVGHALLVEQAVDFEQEIYLSITADPVAGKAIVMACREGGMDIEAIARSTPEKIIKQHIDLSLGMFQYQAQDLLYQLGFGKDLLKGGTDLLLKLFDLFKHYDAELVEINPVMITPEKTFIAADGKLNIDDTALNRHSEFEKTRSYYTTDLEYQAAQVGVPYLQFDGDIGLLVAGAGLANVVFDLIHYYHGTVANYLEFGGPNYHKGKQCLELMLESKPKGILIVTFGTIARADIMALGIVEAYRELRPDIPIVTAIRGTGEDEARILLQETPWESFDDVEQAVQRIIQLTGGTKG